MNPDHLVGKGIIAVHRHKTCVAESDTLEPIVLEDGTALRPVTFEDGPDMGVDFAVERPQPSPDEVGCFCLTPCTASGDPFLRDWQSRIPGVINHHGLTVHPRLPRRRDAESG
jgi:hypothetical protein